MKKKHANSQLPRVVARFFVSPFGVVLSNWVFQGFRYMNAYERTVKIFIDVVIMLAIILLTGLQTSYQMVMVAFLVAHTINWLANGHFVTLLRYVQPIPRTRQQFEDYVTDLREDVAKRSFIKGVAIYGSYCRGSWHPNSDLDLRIIVDETFLAGAIGALYCAFLRAKAFVIVFPLDVYCCVGTECLDRMRPDERPIFLKDEGDMLEGRLPLNARIDSGRDI
jgi:predicted nucleotidyltransferase